jgi:hypothetical protein
VRPTIRIFHIKLEDRAGGMAQATEHLPIKFKNQNKKHLRMIPFNAFNGKLHKHAICPTCPCSVKKNTSQATVGT